MDQSNHDLLGIIAAITAFIHYRVPGVTWLAELTVGGVAASFEWLADFNLGWLSRQSHSIVMSLRGPDSPFILQFFSIRFLLGLAEAGFFPGVIVYLTHWFPARDRREPYPGSLSPHQLRSSSAQNSRTTCSGSAPPKPLTATS